MDHLSRNDIEVIASHIINDYKRLPRFAGQQLRQIDPEVLAQELCGLRLETCRLSKDRRILGMTACSPMEVCVYDQEGRIQVRLLDGKTILLEETLAGDPAKAGRYHFTVMHETAHQLLPRLYPKAGQAFLRQVITYRGHSPSGADWREWQADTLASALLLPADLVWATMEEFGLAPRIKMLNRLYRPREYERFCIMAEILGVSKQALAIRLKRLGWLDEEYLRDPQALIDIVKEDCD